MYITCDALILFDHEINVVSFNAWVFDNGKFLRTSRDDNC